MNYNHGCITARSMPFWCVGNPLSDPFGGAVLEKLDSLDVAKLLAWGAQEGYFEETAWHDDDLVPWNPEQPEDDLDPKSAVYQKLRAIKAVLDGAGIRVNSAVCSLHGNKLFRDGGLCNPDPEIRRLAQLKVERTLRIGQFFNARHFVYWVARDGFEVPVVTDWKQVYDNLADGLNHATDYMEARGMTNYAGATIEPKPNEPRGQMFIPTSGHAVGFILARLKKPDFWGVNPELLQHESMALLNASMTVGFLCAANKLKFLHFGSQIKAQFDDDFPPLIGPEGLKETVFLFHTLKMLHWSGICEYDCHMLRCEADPKRHLECCKQFIANCSTALDMALTLADRIQAPAAGATHSAADLESIRQLCALPAGVNGKR